MSALAISADLPRAEAIMKKIITDRGLETQYSCDSAGTSAYHQGEPADRRMIRHGKSRGYELLSHSRGFVAGDFQKFDYIFTMDQSNYQNVLALDTNSEFSHKVYPIMDFSRAFSQTEVPDPYFGGPAGFDQVIDMLEDACEQVMNQLQNGQL